MKAVLAGLIIGCALISGLFVTASASAAGGWEVAVSEPASFNTSAFCPTSRQIVRVQGYAAKQELCMFGGQSLQFGTFFADGSAPRVAVMFPFDSMFRVVEGLCEGSAGCIYSPQRDVVVSKSSGGVVVFDRVTSRLHFSLETLTYAFDTAGPLYVFQESIGAISLSKNGEWMVIEVKNKGIDLVDINAHDKKRIMAPGVLYGFGRDPAEELAVSNDGKFVAIMGERAGFQLVEISSMCEGACEVVMGDASVFIPNFNFASHPVFDESGTHLSFYAASFGHGMRRVVLRQQGHALQEITYLALGDSFTSGEGEVEDAQYRLGTNDPHERCHLSMRSYPFLLGMHLGIHSSAVQSVACAGAKIVDIVGGSDNYEGQGGRLGRGGRQLLLAEQRIIKGEALDSFQPGRTLQVDFLERYYPSVVTIGIGGNDAGFMGKLKTCAMPDLCEWAADPKYRSATGQEIQDLFVRLQRLYVQIFETTQSLVYAVGYPQIIDPNGVCDPVTTTLLTYAERIFMREGIAHLNRVIKAAIESVGGVYLDIERSLEGRMLCSPEFSLGVNSLRTGDDVSLHTSLSMLKVIGNESFHPTPLGHEMIAAFITQNYGDLREVRSCADCQYASDPPPLPSYWGIRAVGSLRTQSIDMLEDGHLTSASPVLQIRLPTGSLNPFTKAIAEVHSFPRFITETIVNADGSLSFDAPIPQDILEGYHTLHLYTITSALEVVDLYQTISYEIVSDVYSSQLNDRTDGAIRQPFISSAANASVLGAFSKKLFVAHSDSDSIHSPTDLTPKSPAMFVYGFIILLILSGVGAVLVVVRSQRKSTQDPGG